MMAAPRPAATRARTEGNSTQTSPAGQQASQPDRLGLEIEPGQRAQREGHLGITAERRVAAGEDQAQHVVAQRALWLDRLDRLLDLVRCGSGSPPERGGL